MLMCEQKRAMTPAQIRRLLAVEEEDLRVSNVQLQITLLKMRCPDAIKRAPMIPRARKSRG